MITLTCRVCSKQYQRTPKRAIGSSTCSNKCSGAAKRVAPAARSCRACGKPLVQHPGENNHRFNRRVVCGIACRGAAKRRVIPDRTCPTCGKVLVKHAYETAAKFAARRTCNRACSARCRRVCRASEVRRCAHCGKEMPRRAGQTNFNYERTVNCSRACAHEALASLTVGGRRLDRNAIEALARVLDVKPVTVRRRLLKGTP